ncbi:Uncharacterised protein [Mycobacterium tuberculosis]|nr:Uncharacterised protein [Mycobacterium tuberculosis]SIP65108.1 hypothetical protein BN9982_1620002 [Mycobacterium tuberculosis]
MLDQLGSPRLLLAAKSVSLLNALRARTLHGVSRPILTQNEFAVSTNRTPDQLGQFRWLSPMLAW